MGARSTIRDEILSYFEQHPEAADTAEGIAAWWLRRSKAQADMNELSSALECLLAEGRLQVTEHPGAARLYRLADVRTVHYGSRDLTEVATSLGHPASGAPALLLLTGTSTEARKAAAAVATTLQRTLSPVDLNAVLSKYIGETEKSLDQVFAAASQSGSVLFLENADALFGRRTGAEFGRDRDTTGETAALVELVDGFAGVVAVGVQDPGTARSIARRTRRARAVLVV